MATDINYFSILDISLLPVASVTFLSLTYLKLDLQGGIHKGNRETVSTYTQMFTGVAFSTLFSTYLYSVSNTNYIHNFNWHEYANYWEIWSLIEVLIFNHYWTAKSHNCFKVRKSKNQSYHLPLLPSVFPTLMNRINTIYLPNSEESGHILYSNLSSLSCTTYYTEQWLGIRKARFYSMSIIKQLCDLG